MEAAEPGMPMSTAAMKEPDTPPTYMATSMEKLSSVLRAKVMGRIRVMPRPPERPGMAPRIQPTTPQTSIIRKFMGWSRISNASGIAAIISVFLLSYGILIPSRSQTEPEGNGMWKPRVKPK